MRRNIDREKVDGTTLIIDSSTDLASDELPLAIILITSQHLYLVDVDVGLPVLSS